eukprot:8184552-Pyramimonas_sp.AAC.1
MYGAASARAPRSRTSRAACIPCRSLGPSACANSNQRLKVQAALIYGSSSNLLRHATHCDLIVDRDPCCPAI